MQIEVGKRYIFAPRAGRDDAEHAERFRGKSVLVEQEDRYGRVSFMYGTLYEIVGDLDGDIWWARAYPHELQPEADESCPA